MSIEQKCVFDCKAETRLISEKRQNLRLTFNNCYDSEFNLYEVFGHK